MSKNEQMEMFQEFEQMEQVPADQITIQQLDKMVLALQQERQLYDEKKKAASEQNAKVEQLENEIMGVLSKLGKTSYEAEGVGRITKCMSLVYKTPKTNVEKEALFNYIRGKYGEEVYTAMVSVNHQTLNSWANKEMSEEGVGKIPGLEAPTSVEYIQLRSKK